MAEAFSGTLVFHMQPTLATAIPVAPASAAQAHRHQTNHRAQQPHTQNQQQQQEQVSKRRRQEGSFDKWKYKVQTENDPASSAKRQRSNNVKKVKERERRTKMAESIQALRDLLPGCDSRRSNQVLVMNTAAEYIKKLEEAMKTLQAENDLFRNAFGEANLALPRGVAKDRFHFEFEMLSAMDDSDSDDEEPSMGRSNRPLIDPRSTSPLLPLPLPLTDFTSPLLGPVPNSLFSTDKSGTLSSGSSFAPSSVPSSLSSSASSLSTSSTSSSSSLPMSISPPLPSSSVPSTPIPIPGTVGAPIRPHETRTRLERVTGSSQHLVNKNPRKQSPGRDRIFPPAESFQAMHEDQEHEEGSGTNSNKGSVVVSTNSPDMMEAMDFMNDIEEVGAWPLYSNASTSMAMCRDPTCSNFQEHASHSRPPSAGTSLNSLQSLLNPLHSLNSNSNTSSNPFNTNFVTNTLLMSSPTTPFKLVGSAADSPTNPGKFDSPIQLAKFDSPNSGNKSAPSTFSPKLIFVDSPSNPLAGASYSTYVNPFDSNF